MSAQKSRVFLIFGVRVKKLNFRKVRSESVLAILLVAAAFFVGCRSNVSNSNTTSPETVSMRRVTDDLGRTVIIPVKITRAVSLAPNLTENIFAIGAGDRLVGVTTFCNYPEQAKSIAKIGDTMTPNMESIIALKPDIVFVSTASQIEVFMTTLEQQGIVVFVSDPNSLDDVFQSLIQLGDLFGTRDQAETLVSNLSGRVGQISHLVSFVEPRAERTVLPRVFVQISREPLFTIGKDSFITQLIKAAYGESVTADVETAYPKLSKETALALNPDVIILSESDDNRLPNEVFRNSPAVRDGRIYKVNADLLSRPGPRLVDAMEQIAKSLHQEKLRNK